MTPHRTPQERGKQQSDQMLQRSTTAPHSHVEWKKVHTPTCIRSKPAECLTVTAHPCIKSATVQKSSPTNGATMKLEQITIEGYRAHSKTTFSLEDDLTVIVGRNNTGKTSLVEVIDKFIGQNARNRLRTTDFAAEERNTLSKALEEKKTEDEAEKYLPHITLNLLIGYDLSKEKKADTAVIAPYFTSLDTECKQLEVECRYAPQDAKTLWGKLLAASTDQTNIDQDKLLALIEKAGEYKVTYRAKSVLKEHQTDPANAANELKREDVQRIINTEFIYAQINLDDTSTDGGHYLSTAFEDFYKEVATDDKLRANLDSNVEQIQYTLTDAYKTFFQGAIREIHSFTKDTHGGALSLTVASELKTSRLINATTRVKFKDNSTLQTYPESHNGLGYSRLTYTILQILAFKERRTNKQYRSPINMLLIEEPEAHLHPQMQEVFIRLVTNLLNDDTQLLITTHSSHILSERKLEKLRYLKREAGKIVCKNISEWAARLKHDNRKAHRIISNYLHLRVSDLFFADCAILIEGAAERILLPKAITKSTNTLSSTHYTVIEVGGTYAQHFIPLLKYIEIPTIIITDIDSVQLTTNEETNKASQKKARPKLDDNLFSSNPTLNHYFSNPAQANEKPTIKRLLQLNSSDKQVEDSIRICYQSSDDGYTCSDGTVLFPRSLEDAIIYANARLFTDLVSPKQKPRKAQSSRDTKSRDVQESEDRHQFEEPHLNKLFDKQISADTFAKKAYTTTNARTFEKTTFAIDCVQFEDLSIPHYISEGLRWLEQMTTDSIESTTHTFHQED